MISSLWTAKTGLEAQQVQMDVIANNLANVSTNGFKRTRVVAYAALVVFHVLTGALFPIGMFPVIMIVSALVFFPPDWPR